MMMTTMTNASSTIKLSSFPSKCAASRVAAATRNCGKRSFLRVSAEQQQRYETSADASSSSSSLLVHTVAPGDSLYGVAMQYDVDPKDLIVRFSLFSLSLSLSLSCVRLFVCLSSSLLL
jgi:LysM repeat protein